MVSSFSTDHLGFHQFGVGDEAVSWRAGHPGPASFVGDEEGGVFLQAGDDADMCALDVEEERTRHRVLTGGDGFGRGRDAGHRADLQLVLVVFVERQAEDADTVRVCVDTGQRFRVVAVDVDRTAVGTQVHAGVFRVVFRHAAVDHGLHGARWLHSRSRTTFSSKTSRVPCLVPGGKAAMMSTAGRLGLKSAHCDCRGCRRSWPSTST